MIYVFFEGILSFFSNFYVFMKTVFSTQRFLVMYCRLCYRFFSFLFILITNAVCKGVAIGY